jgi:hypothetical protein
MTDTIIHDHMAAVEAAEVVVLMVVLVTVEPEEEKE